VFGLSLLEAWEKACLASTALLVSVVTWYPPLFKEDAHGHACQSRRAAGIERVFGVFQVCLRRPEGREALERCVTGLLTELLNKNCDTIVQTISDTSEHRLQEFLTIIMQWDETDLHR
jgi:hypothetical protein